MAIVHSIAYVLKWLYGHEVRSVIFSYWFYVLSMGFLRVFYGYGFFNGSPTGKNPVSTLWPVPVLKLTATWLANLTSANLWSHKSSGTGWPLQDPRSRNWHASGGICHIPPDLYFHLIADAFLEKSGQQLHCCSNIPTCRVYPQLYLQPICNIGYKPANLLVILVLSHLTFTQIRFDLALT